MNNMANLPAKKKAGLENIQHGGKWGWDREQEKEREGREGPGRNRLNPKMHFMVQILDSCLKVKGTEVGDESILLLTIALLTIWLKQGGKNPTAIVLLWKYYIWKFLV